MQKSLPYVLVGILGLLIGVGLDMKVRDASNSYVGSVIYGQALWIAVFCTVSGISGSLLIRKWRFVPLALLTLGLSYGLGLVTLAHLFPYTVKPLSSAERLVEGWLVRVQFREGTTGEQENLFLCKFVYSECTTSGHDLPAEIISITRTDYGVLTIATTTSEFQGKLLRMIREAPIVRHASAEGLAR